MKQNTESSWLTSTKSLYMEKTEAKGELSRTFRIFILRVLCQPRQPRISIWHTPAFASRKVLKFPWKGRYFSWLIPSARNPRDIFQRRSRQKVISNQLFRKLCTNTHKNQDPAHPNPTRKPIDQHSTFLSIWLLISCLQSSHQPLSYPIPKNLSCKHVRNRWTTSWSQRTSPPVPPKG